MLSRGVAIAVVALALVALTAAPTDALSSRTARSLAKAKALLTAAHAKHGHSSEPLEESADDVVVDEADALTAEATREEEASLSKCSECADFFDLMDVLLSKGTNMTEIERTAETVCIVAGVNADVCNGAVVEFAPEFVYLINNTYKGHSRDMCWFLGMCVSAQGVRASHGWQSGHTLADLPAATAAFSTPTDAATAETLAAEADVGTFLQLTDLHYDSEYTPGSATNCGKPTCCHSIDGIGVPPHVAGTFGDYHCDGAPALQDAVMAEIAALSPKPDFVLWTGDEAPDDVWQQSRQANIDDIVFLANAVGQALPGITAFPSVGNHEPFPIAQLDGPASFGSDDWLYTAMGRAWSSPQAPWLDAEAVNTLAIGGYYSQKARDGLRVVAFNTQHGTPGNYWLMRNASDDPAGQLAWLNTTLARAQRDGEHCYLIAHIPNGNEMLASYAERFHQIVGAYHDTVAALLYGHTHMDSISVRRDVTTNTVPQNIAFVAPSVTPQTNINPSYRVYSYDRRTGEILDYAQYTADLTAGNAAGKLTFTLAYTARDAYNLTALRPADWQAFVNRMQSGGVSPANPLLTRYIQHHYTVGRPTLGCETNPVCSARMVCDAASFTPDLYRRCMNSTHTAAPRGSCSDAVDLARLYA